MEETNYETDYVSIPAERYEELVREEARMDILCNVICQCSGITLRNLVAIIGRNSMRKWLEEQEKKYDETEDIEMDA